MQKIQKAAKTTAQAQGYAASAAPVSVCQDRVQRKAQLVQKYIEEKVAYTLRADEEIGFIDGCFDDSSDELALLREFGL